MNFPPSFGVKESDFIFHILYQCIICTNSRSVPVGKHSDKIVPTQLERGFAETAPHHAIHLYWNITPERKKASSNRSLYVAE